jgi:5'-deoxynucleotidase YfbR-like HD superfamily hydrolase
LKLALAGGDVRRYHTFREGFQTVGEHTYRVFHIAMFLADRFQVELTVSDINYIMCHDIAEAVTGDAPFSAKRTLNGFKSSMDRMEEQVLQNHGYRLTLPPGLYPLVKAADMVEMGYFAMDQVHRGNNEYKEVSQNIIEAVQANMDAGDSLLLWKEALHLLLNYEPAHQGSEAI